MTWGRGRKTYRAAGHLLLASRWRVPFQPLGVEAFLFAFERALSLRGSLLRSSGKWVSNSTQTHTTRHTIKDRENQNTRESSCTTAF